MTKTARSPVSAQGAAWTPDSRHPSTQVVEREVRESIDWTPWLLVGPAVVFFVLFFLAPLVTMFVTSFYRYDSGQGIITEPTLENYVSFVSDSFYLGILWRTLKLGVIVTVVAAAIGYPVAYYLAQSTGRRRTYATLIIVAPLLVSVVVRTFGWLVLLGTNGLVNAVLVRSGLVVEPVKFMFSETAIVIGLTHVFLPFMVLAIANSLANIPAALPLAAASLGASRFQTLRRVTLPLSLPGILAGSLLVFTLSTSAFITPELLGGARVKVMATLMYRATLLLNNWPSGAAIAVVLLAITGASVLAYTRVLEGGKFKDVFR